jgi:branched-chain amino acid transport system substrate-binding protein
MIPMRCRHSIEVGRKLLKRALFGALIFAVSSGGFVAGVRPADSQISDGVVRIGVLGNYGSGRDIGGPGSVTAAKLATSEFNNSILGRPIEIVAADHQNKPDVASAIARKWFEIDRVDAITDLAVSSVGLSVARLAAGMNRTALISGAATSDLTGVDCAPIVTHWADDTYVLSRSLGRAVTERVGKTWYFVAADFSFGHAMLRDGRTAVEAAGGRVLGSIRFPYNTSDFSSFLIPALASGAKVLALASTGDDTINGVKQAREFGLQSNGITVVGLLTFVSDVHALGLEIAQGMYVSEQYYWNDDEASRDFARRFFEIEKKMPTKLQAATYAAVRHYLRAIETSGTDEAKAVNAQMRRMPVDFFGRPAHIRADGRVIYDLGLYRVKTPTASRFAWDYYEKIATVFGSEAFRPEGEGGCALK